MEPREEPQELVALRSAIDALDEQLVGLLVAREQLVRRAGDVKASDADVRASGRARAVVERAGQLADARGGSREAVEAIYETIVATFTALELRHRG